MYNLSKRTFPNVFVMELPTHFHTSLAQNRCGAIGWARTFHFSSFGCVDKRRSLTANTKRTLLPIYHRIVYCNVNDDLYHSRLFAIVIRRVLFGVTNLHSAPPSRFHLAPFACIVVIQRE